jgi:putative MATE family efflux protein
VGNYLLINPTRQITVFGVSFTMIGAGWGVEGAAVATALGMAVAGILALYMAFRKSNPYHISLKEKGAFLPDKDLLRQVFKISFPAMLERICMSASGIVVTKSIATLGTASVAANAVYSTAESLSFMPAFAFATAATTLVGQALGARKPDLAKRYTWHTVYIGVFVMLLAGAGLFFFATPLVRFINADPEVVAIAERCLRIVAFVQPVQVIAWVLAGALRGAGDTKWPFYITAAGNWLIRALGAVLCIRVFHLGLPKAVACMCFDQAARSVCMYLRFRTGKWMHVIKDKKEAA